MWEMGIAPSGDGGYASYRAAKAAIAHYRRYLAQDLGPFGITANCIVPGVIATGRIMAIVIPGSIQGNQIGPNWLRCGGSGRLRTVRRSSNFLPPICRTT
jgi:NAD(P)-dependent dehydrogenase (short-subunit alcohol dehydrogenase family)